MRQLCGVRFVDAEARNNSVVLLIDVEPSVAEVPVSGIVETQRETTHCHILTHSQELLAMFVKFLSLIMLGKGKATQYKQNIFHLSPLSPIHWREKSIINEQI
ncbi:hypothetical protein L1887_36527 [Cichorium endivia]|nr:hypothetical protein L1887_36527 [Cichorium endivia]